MSIVADAVSTGLAGMATGFIGSLVTAGLKVFGMWNERKAKEEERDYELALIDREIDRDAKRYEHMLNVTAEAGANALLIAGIKAQAAIPASYRWVNAVIALMRPGITIGLVYASFRVFTILHADPGAADPQLFSLAADLYFMTGSAISYWFADRSFSKRYSTPVM